MAEVLKATQGLLSTVYSYIPGLPSSKEVEKVIIREIEMPRPSAFYRLAGLSGAIAVAMGAYGAHDFQNWLHDSSSSLRGSDGDSHGPQTRAGGLTNGNGHSVVLWELLLPRPEWKHINPIRHPLRWNDDYLCLAGHGIVTPIKPHT
ncbi:uncharacterized protein [Haliotis asinina]|uniref:uncharacterized protein isoform X2 n=1 Tax=Haliotis asinina TaxID=109174 RepID=UPI003532142A